MDASHCTPRGVPIWGRATPDEHIHHAMIQILDTCIHFNGLSQQTCLAGVSYWADGPQPCIQMYDTGKHLCPQRQFPTEEEALQRATIQEQEIREALAQMASRRVMKQCLVCGTPYTTRRQVGRCIYVEPCGHRQGQGRI